MNRKLAPVVLIVGPTQVGKSAAIAELVSCHAYRFVPTYTTRAPRAGEIDGRDYHFITPSEFQRRIRAVQFEDWDYFLNSYGGIPSEPFIQSNNEHTVLHVLARMALRIEERHRQAVAVFLAPKDMSLVYGRISAAFDEAAVVNARCAQADEEMLHSVMFRQLVRIDATMSVSDVANEIHACVNASLS